MSKTPLSPLSSIMPPKGEAARAEEVPESARAPLAVNLRDEAEPRDGMTIRIVRSVNKRLKAMAYTEGMTKQAILDRAIVEFLDRHKY